VFKDLSKKRGWAAYWGEIMTTIMKKLGTVGVVTDGAVRDLEQVEKIGFHFFSSTVVVSHGDLKIVDINIPVEITGVTIKPGDLLHGDMNGVVIIPEEIAKEVITASQKIIDRESQILRVINREGFDPSQLREFYH
jgi:regulator of RNase E activity RraA